MEFLTQSVNLIKLERDAERSNCELVHESLLKIKILDEGVWLIKIVINELWTYNEVAKPAKSVDIEVAKPGKSVKVNEKDYVVYDDRKEKFKGRNIFGKEV